MKKLFISADLEGCAAVASRGALTPERWAWEWTAARRWMTREVIAVAETALAAGYQEVIVADSHGNAHNIDPDLLPNDVWLVRSWPRPLLHMQGVEEEAVDACVLLGYHAEASAMGSIIAHTFSGATLRAMRINGELCSEGYFNAALAGEFGKPVIFVSGDQQTTDDAERYAPNAVRHVTKKSIGWTSQASLSPIQTCEMLRDASAKAFNQPLPAAFVLDGPFQLELEVANQAIAEMLSFLPGMNRRGAWTVCRDFDDLRAIAKFLSFCILYTPSGTTAF